MKPSRRSLLSLSVLCKYASSGHDGSPQQCRQLGDYGDRHCQWALYACIRIRRFLDSEHWTLAVPVFSPLSLPYQSELRPQSQSRLSRSI